MIAFCLSLSWGVLLSSVLIAAPQELLLLIVCVIVGVTAAGVLNVATVPLASFAFMAGSLIMIAFDVLVLIALPKEVLALLAVFVFILGRSIFDQASLFTNNFEASASLVEASIEREQLAVAARIEKERVAQAQVDAREARDQMVAQRQRDMLSLAERFDRTVGDALSKLGEAVAVGRSTTAALAKQSAADAQDASEISRTASETVLAADALSLTADSLRGSVSNVIERVKLQERLTADARRRSHDSEEATNALVAHTSDIDKIVGLIDEIAARTDLLALNASIEAARAGVAGRGFAVVADEVKGLAAQTRQATDEIQQRVIQVQDLIQLSAKSTRAIARCVEHVIDIAAEIDAAMDIQKSITHAISVDTEKTSEGTSVLSLLVTQKLQTAVEAQSLTSDIASSSAAVHSEVNNLLQRTQDLLRDLRAA